MLVTIWNLKKKLSSVSLAVKWEIWLSEFAFCLHVCGHHAPMIYQMLPNNANVFILDFKVSLVCQGFHQVFVICVLGSDRREAEVQWTVQVNLSQCLWCPAANGGGLLCYINIAHSDSDQYRSRINNTMEHQDESMGLSLITSGFTHSAGADWVYCKNGGVFCNFFVCIDK